MTEGDLSKEKQAGRYGRKAKTERKAPQGEKEDFLQKHTIAKLKKLGLEYIRISDNVWRWIAWHAPDWVKLEMSENYGGWPDQLIFVRRGEYNLVLLLELTRPGRKLRQSQEDISKKHNVKVAKTVQEVNTIINNFVEFSKMPEFPHKYPKFEDFWNTVSNRDKDVGILTMAEIKQWSETVFKQARARKI